MSGKVVGYCVKHKGKTAMANPTLHRMEGRGRLGYVAKGKCPDDGTGMFMILSADKYAELKAAGLSEGALIKKKSKGAKKSKSGGRTSGGRASGGRRRRSRSKSKGRK